MMSKSGCWKTGRCATRWSCDLLMVELDSNEVATAVARGNVRGQTAPNHAGIIKTIACATLIAHRSPATG